MKLTKQAYFSNQLSVTNNSQKWCIAEKHKQIFPLSHWSISELLV